MSNGKQEIGKAHTPVSAVTLIASCPASLAFHRNGLRMDLGDVTIYEDRLPTTEQRAKLEARKAQLTRALSASLDDEAMGMIGVMLASMPSQAGDQAQAHLRGIGYRIALEDLPGWAVAATVKRFLRGEVGDSKFCPPPHELRKAVSDSIARWRQELSEIEMIFEARPIAPPKSMQRSIGGQRVSLDEMLAERARLFGISRDDDKPHVVQSVLDDLDRRRAKRTTQLTQQGEAA